MRSRIASVETLTVSIPREDTYLGPLGSNDEPTHHGYFVRAGNRTVYARDDRTVLVRIASQNGVIGWGETYGLAAPGAVVEIIEDLLQPFLIDRDARDPVVIHEDLYNLMRVRGHFGGYYLDALAAVDIAIWDLCARIHNVPLSQLLGGQRSARLPAYVSGLPSGSLADRTGLAREWVAKGYRAIKFAAAVANEGEIAEMSALRKAVGPEVALMVDLHWRYSAGEAIKLISALAVYDLYFAEAPCSPEDVQGQARVAAAVPVPIALGEELRTVFEFHPRLIAHCMDILQPEMGHTGVTEFRDIGRMARAFNLRLIPHATIGTGIFLAASLQVASTFSNAPFHEYQPSIFDRYRHLVTGDMRCEAGFYNVPTGPGLGVEPSEHLLAIAQRGRIHSAPETSMA